MKMNEWMKNVVKWKVNDVFFFVKKKENIRKTNQSCSICHFPYILCVKRGYIISVCVVPFGRFAKPYVMSYTTFHNKLKTNWDAPQNDDARRFMITMVQIFFPSVKARLCSNNMTLMRHTLMMMMKWVEV